MSNQTVHFFFIELCHQTRVQARALNFQIRDSDFSYTRLSYTIPWVYSSCIYLLTACRRLKAHSTVPYLEAKPIATFAIVQRKNNCALCATMCFIDVFICLWGCLCLWGIVCLSLKLSLYLGCLWLWRFLYIGFHICLMYVCVMLVCMHVLCICLCDCMRVCMYACLVYVSYVCLMYTYIHNRAMHVFCVCFVCIDMFQKYLT